MTNKLRKDFYKFWAVRFREMRMDSGLSVEELCEILDFNPARYRAIEKGQRIFNAYEFQCLAHTLLHVMTLQ